jgi:NAD(P)H-flavin reductase
MLEAPGRPLPRPFSLCTASAGELGFLVEPLGKGTTAIASLDVGDVIHVTGPLGRGFDHDVATTAARGRRHRRRAVPLPLRAPRRPTCALGFRTAFHAEAAGLVPNATVVLDPVLVTDALPPDPGDVLACGPEAMLDALARVVPDAQLAREAPMACGYGACYGCVVDRDGR